MKKILLSIKGNPEAIKKMTDEPDHIGLNKIYHFI
jgi:hypothetical protein